MMLSLKKLFSGSVDSDLGTEQTVANSIGNVCFFITFLNSFFDKKKLLSRFRQDKKLIFKTN